MTEKNKGKNKDHFEHFQGRIACGKSKASSLDAWIPTGRHGGPSTHLKDDPDSSVRPSCVYVKSHGGHLPVSLETWISVAFRCTHASLWRAKLPIEATEAV